MSEGTTGSRFKGPIDSGFLGPTAGRGAMRAKYFEGAPNRSHVSPSILAYEDEAVGMGG